MKQIEEIRYFEEIELTEWQSLQPETIKHFQELLEIDNADQLRLIVGIKDQENEIWEWRDYFKEIKEITEQANYQEQDYSEEDGLIEVAMEFGFVALVEFNYKDKVYKGILFQDASPAGIFIKQIQE